MIKILKRVILNYNTTTTNATILSAKYITIIYNYRLLYQTIGYIKPSKIDKKDYNNTIILKW